MSRKKVEPFLSVPFSVHLLTASGAAFALLSGLALMQGNIVMAFTWLGVALFVDGVDGPLARRLAISEVLPRWSGAALDFVIDYTTYVFLPALILIAAGVLPSPYDIIAAVLIVVSGALYFADTQMKTADSSFRGFPAVWNVAVFDLLVADLGAIATFSILILLAALTFAPIHFVHPVRVKRWRPLTLTVTALWAVFCAVALLQDMQPDPWAYWGLLVTTAYLSVIGFIIQMYNRREVR
ncbi:MAG: phosphatidylcholine synthase [Hyphomicrobiales bacterium]|nr:MAG: phosphatidylcholine synthase [Hyphomicrobiales bacterium]